MRRLRLLPALILTSCTVSLAASASRIDPDNPPKGRFIDEWYVVRFGDAEAGWAHSTCTRAADRVTSRVDMELTIRRAGQKIEMRTSESTTESIAGEPVSFETLMKLSVMEISVKGRIERGKVFITTSQFGNTTEQTHDYPKGAKMNWGALAEQYRRGLEPGTNYTLEIYAPTLRADGPVISRVNVERKEPVEMPDGTKDAVRVATSIEVPGGFPMGQLETVGWLKDDGSILKSQIPLPGFGTMEMVRADKATAQAAGRTGAEIFVSTLIPVDKPIPCQEAKAINFELRFTGPEDDDPPNLPATAMQRPATWNNRTLKLRVARVDPKQLRDDAKRPLGIPGDAGPEASNSEYRTANLWINSQDAEVVRMAKEAVGTAEDRYTVCDQLRRYVTRVIRSKNLGVGFATASEVARHKEGDCSEHAVLLAALGRALGIPSRVVTGLVYVPSFGEAEHVFGFHMWTQFYIGGTWVDFDAAQRESDCNPTHIALATSSMSDVTMAEFAFSLLGSIGQLEIKVVSVEPAGP